MSQLEGLDVSPDEVRAANNPLHMIRRPEVLFTEGYLNNPIRFSPDEGLFEDRPDIELVEDAPLSYTRDLGNFLLIEVNSRDEEDRFLNIPLRTFSYSRVRFDRVFDTEFTELS
jgi:hypothetical protein